MDELLARIDDEFCDSDGGLRIVGAEWFANDLRLDISVLMCEEKEAELWRITCSQVFEERLSSEFADFIAVTDDSPLLAPYKDKEVQIAFSENRASPNELFGIIATACYELVGRTADIFRFLNTLPNGEEICASQYGILGRFPERVAKKIVSGLSGLDIKARMLEGFEPKYWTGSEHIPYPPSIKVLSIGSSYVVGADFSATRA